MSGDYTCARCGAAFDVPRAALDKYPGWQPSTCLTCRDTAREAKGQRPAVRRRPRRATGGRPTPDEARERWDTGPVTGLFTDGGTNPNPGPGAWAVAWVRNDEVLAERTGRADDTTNNRMELTALLEAYELLPPGEGTTIYSDSELAVKTVTEWAPRWERAGWRRKTGPVKNLDLVRRLLARSRARPEIELAWVPAHAGWRWNEYVDALVQWAREGD